MSILVRELSPGHINAGIGEALRRSANPGSFILPTAVPPNPVKGQIHYDDASDVIYIYNSRQGWREI